MSCHVVIILCLSSFSHPKTLPLFFLFIYLFTSLHPPCLLQTPPGLQLPSFSARSPWNPPRTIDIVWSRSLGKHEHELLTLKPVVALIIVSSYQFVLWWAVGQMWLTRANNVWLIKIILLETTQSVLMAHVSKSGEADTFPTWHGREKCTHSAKSSDLSPVPSQSLMICDANDFHSDAIHSKTKGGVADTESLMC